jgi:hypothetical protein
VDNTITKRFSRSNRTSIGIALRGPQRYQLLPGRRAHNSPFAPDVVSASAAPSVQALQWATHTRIVLRIVTRGSAYEARARGGAGSNSTKTSRKPLHHASLWAVQFLQFGPRILASRFNSSHSEAQYRMSQRSIRFAICLLLSAPNILPAGPFVLKHSQHWPEP